MEYNKDGKPVDCKIYTYTAHRGSPHYDDALKRIGGRPVHNHKDGFDHWITGGQNPDELWQFTMPADRSVVIRMVTIALTPKARARQDKILKSLKN